MTLVIEPVQRDDIALLDAIANEANQAQVFPLLSPEGVETVQGDQALRWHRPLNEDGYGSLKAVLGNKPVGYIRWRDDHYVYALYVAPEQQGQGIGRRLMDAMLAHCAAPEIRLRSSINAVGFYRRYGFAAEGEEAVFKGIRFVPMVYRR